MSDVVTHAASRPSVAPVARRLRVSVVTPAYNEERNLPVLYGRLRSVLDRLDVDWEWIVTDDHSSDATFDVVSKLNRDDPRVVGVRFSRNFGSHTGVTCGLHHARGDCAVVMASDLQDPPEVLPQLVEAWRGGAQVVWAVSDQHESQKVTSGLFYWIMRNVVEAAPGADFFLIDRRVMEAIRGFEERNVNLFALLAWVGFRQQTVNYTKEARLHGQSNYTLQKRIKLAVDSITAFSYLPLRIMSWSGILTAVGGFAYAILIIYNAISGTPVEGWSSLMVGLMVIGGFQMLMLGILGEYVWRALDEARRRPRYTVEATTDAFGRTELPHHADVQR